jgi:hypothetical protein
VKRQREDSEDLGNVLSQAIVKRKRQWEDSEDLGIAIQSFVKKGIEDAFSQQKQRPAEKISASSLSDTKVRNFMNAIGIRTVIVSTLLYFIYNVTYYL